MISNDARPLMGVRKLTPIIDFDCIVDTEYGLLQLIYDQYYDLSVFNKEKFDMPTSKILLELYNRTCRNPLIPFINEGIPEEDADEYYAQFMSSKYENIIDRSCGTNLQMVINNYNNSGEITASILCHNELQKEYISGLKIFEKNKVVMEDEFLKNFLDFNQFFMRYVDDISKYVKQCFGKTVYFSSCKLNMNEDGVTLKETEDMKYVKRLAFLSYYDLYNLDYLKGE